MTTHKYQGAIEEYVCQIRETEQQIQQLDAQRHRLIGAISALQDLQRKEEEEEESDVS